MLFFFFCLPVRFDNLFVILTKHCRILVRLFYKIYLMCHRNISWGSYRVYGCVCVVYIGMSVCAGAFLWRGGCQKCFVGWWEWLAGTFQHSPYQGHTHTQQVQRDPESCGFSDYHSPLTSRSVSERCIYSFFKQQESLNHKLNQKIRLKDLQG